MLTTKIGAAVREIGSCVATTGATHWFINMKEMIIKICSLVMCKNPQNTQQMSAISHCFEVRPASLGRGSLRFFVPYFCAHQIYCVRHYNAHTQYLTSLLDSCNASISACKYNDCSQTHTVINANYLQNFLPFRINNKKG